MGDGIGLAVALLGLDAFQVLEVDESPAELVVGAAGHQCCGEGRVKVETTTVVGCAGCGVRAEAQDRVERALRDLPCFGRPTRLVWSKLRWHGREPLCERKTWTETSPDVDAQQVLTDRAGCGGVPPAPLSSPARCDGSGGRTR